MSQSGSKNDSDENSYDRGGFADAEQAIDVGKAVNNGGSGSSIAVFDESSEEEDIDMLTASKSGQDNLGDTNINADVSGGVAAAEIEGKGNIKDSSDYDDSTNADEVDMKLRHGDNAELNEESG